VNRSLRTRRAPVFMSYAPRAVPVGEFAAAHATRAGQPIAVPWPNRTDGQEVLDLAPGAGSMLNS